MVLTLSLSRSAWLKAVIEIGTTWASSSRLRAVTTTFSSSWPWPFDELVVRGAVPAVPLAWPKAGLAPDRLAAARLVGVKRAASRRLDIGDSPVRRLGRVS